MTDYGDWLGREQRSADLLTPSLAARWCATFDRDAPQTQDMPQAIHLCLCPPDARTAALAEDGHPRREPDPAAFLPPVPLPRRMWTGSAMTFHAPISVGSRITRHSTIGSIDAKQGKRGAMTFVTVAHRFHADDTLAVTEEQTLVFLEAVAPDAPLVPPVLSQERFDETGWEKVRTLVPDERLLFRFSALTFNTHRIHYDADYARDKERYRGLVVHGPLMASLLLELANAGTSGNALARFRFRAISPAIANEPLILACRQAGKTLTLGAFAQDGRQIVEAAAERQSAG